MTKSPSGILIPGALAVVGAALLVWWPVTDVPVPLEERKPGMDGWTGSGSASPVETPVPGDPIRSRGRPSELAGQWPWFRGTDLDAIYKGEVSLAREWPKTGPKRLWSVELGQGFAGAAVRDGCVYVLDYDERALADTMRCLSLDDGREIWRNGYPVEVAWNHGMSRTVPAIVGKCVISLGPKCHVACFDAQTGQARWLLDLVKDYGATVPPWYAGQCPLVDGGRLIVAPGGDALLMAVDCESGKTIWESPNPRGWAMTHTSVVPMEFAGKRTYVYCGTGGVAGVSADDGAILWETTAWKIDMATCPSPVIVSAAGSGDAGAAGSGDAGGRIFLCGGYESGAMMLQLQQEGRQIKAEVLFRLTPRQFGSEQQTPVLFAGAAGSGDAGHLYGVRHKRQGAQLVCLDLDGNEVWNSGREKFGSGPYMIADGLIYVMDDDGWLTMAEATPSQYKRLGRAEVIEGGVHAWAPMALVAGRLILRDMTRMVCLDVSAAATADR